jgi:hypothetical protein
MQISALLGQDMTGTLRPAVAMSAQNAYATTAQQDKPQQIPLTRAQSLGVANRAEYGTVARREAQRGVGSWNRSNR